MTKQKEKTSLKKETNGLKNQAIECFLKNIVENELLDDHGIAIIGKRERKLRDPSEE